MPERRRASLLAVVAASALLLAGCASIPNTGGVQDGGQINSDTGGDDIALQPNGPQTGASQRDILSGFLDAATDAASNYSVARSFLSTGLKDQWDPNQLLTIRDGSESVDTVEGDDQALDYTISASAYVDSSGQYQEERTSLTQTKRIEFVRERGQWRISSVPDGIVLSEARFQTQFASYPLWYFDPEYRFLVPDVRWFAKRRTNLPAVVVGQLLQGPAEYFGEGAVITAFPSGTSRGQGVDISGGDATVDLSEEAADASATQQGRMRQELLQTLRTSFSVSSVTMTVNGLEMPQPNTAPPDATAEPTVNANPVVLAGGVVGYATGSNAPASLPALGQPLAAAKPDAFTIDAEASRAVLRDADGVSRITAQQTDPQLLDRRAGLLAPSLDPDGVVWSTTPYADSVRVFGPDGAAHDLALPLGGNASLRALDVSRDGTRLLLAYDDGSGSHLAVLGVVRQQGVPVSVSSAPLQLPVASGTLLDAAWIDSQTVASITDAGGGAQVTSYTVGGPSLAQGSAPGATVIAGGNGGISGVRVLAQGAVLQQRGSAWQATGSTADVLGTQQ